MRKKQPYFKIVCGFLCAVVIALSFVTAGPTETGGKKEVAPIAQKKSEFDIEAYIRSKVVKEDIVPNLVPAAIYYKRPGMAKEEFCCVGTLCSGPGGTPQIVTAEHIFRTDLKSGQTMSVRPLRGTMDPPVAYIGKIVAKGRTLGGPSGQEKDILVAELDTQPTVVEPFSSFVKTESAQNFWGDVVIDGNKIPRLRSILSGEYVETLGYTRRGDKENDPVFVIINSSAREGESGTGFVDDFGQLWVLHGGVDFATEKEICTEGMAITGRKITGVATVSGPLFRQKN